jgi:hypothetical protein
MVSMVLFPLSAYPHTWISRITSTPRAPPFEGCSMFRTTIRVPMSSLYRNGKQLLSSIAKP